MCNDFGNKQDFYVEVKRLLKEEGLEYKRPNFWVNAYEDNVLPYDAVKVYLKMEGILQ